MLKFAQMSNNFLQQSYYLNALDLILQPMSKPEAEEGCLPKTNKGEPPLFRPMPSHVYRRPIQPRDMPYRLVRNRRLTDFMRSVRYKKHHWRDLRRESESLPEGTERG